MEFHFSVWPGASTLLRPCRLIGFNFDKIRFGVSKGDLIICHTAFDGVAQGRPADYFNFGIRHKSQVQETLAYCSFGVMAADSCALPGFDILEHATFTLSSHSFPMSRHNILQLNFSLNKDIFRYTKIQWITTTI
jgi:hypothetical protein